MLFDPVYLLFALPGLLLSMWASYRVRAAFDAYSQVGSVHGYTGAQAAQRLLDDAGLHDVGIVETDGYLSDHYDPTSRQLALSSGVYHGQSLASIGVACHEAGHALQHAIQPVANLDGPVGRLDMHVAGRTLKGILQD